MLCGLCGLRREVMSDLEIGFLDVAPGRHSFWARAKRALCFSRRPFRLEKKNIDFVCGVESLFFGFVWPTDQVVGTYRRLCVRCLFCSANGHRTAAAGSSRRLPPGKRLPVPAPPIVFRPRRPTKVGHGRHTSVIQTQHSVWLQTADNTTTLMHLSSAPLLKTAAPSLRPRLVGICGFLSGLHR